MADSWCKTFQSNLIMIEEFEDVLGNAMVVDQYLIVVFGPRDSSVCIVEPRFNGLPFSAALISSIVRVWPMPRPV